MTLRRVEVRVTKKVACQKCLLLLVGHHRRCCGLLASACLPALHHVIEIDGESYWDGGLTANPPIRPLLYQCSARDIVVVLLHPCRRPEVPTTADDIWHR